MLYYLQISMGLQFVLTATPFQMDWNESMDLTGSEVVGHRIQSPHHHCALTLVVTVPAS